MSVRPVAASAVLAVRSRAVRRRVALAGALALALAGGGACGGEGTGPEAITGTYALRRVDGRPLPFTTVEPPDRQDIARVLLVLKESGRYELDTTMWVYVGVSAFTPTESSTSGTYTWDGTVLTLQPTSGDAFTLRNPSRHVLTGTAAVGGVARALQFHKCQLSFSYLGSCA